MSWFSDLISESSKNWFYSQIPDAQTPGDNPPKEISRDNAYLHIFLRSMRIVNVRNGFSKFYPTIHSNIEVANITGKPAIFNCVTTPTNLEALDSENLDRVINISQRLLGPVPYRGGGVKVEAGLFSVKQEDLAEPFITLLKGMSNLAGVSFLSAALPYIKPIEDGISLLTGSAKNTILELGLKIDYDKISTGYYVVMGADTDQVKKESLYIRKSDYGLVDKNGNNIKDYPYMVLEIMSTEEREDWFNIPEVSSAYESLRTTLSAGKIEEAKEALIVLKRVLYNSPDLLFEQAKNLFRVISEEFEQKTALLEQVKLASTSEALPLLKDILEGVDNFDGYEGYKPDFLSTDEVKIKVPAPVLTKFNDDLVKLNNLEEYELKYVNYSAVLSKSRKFPIYTASNIDGSLFKRVPRNDKWRKDTRIPLEYQFGKELYSADMSGFDKGHMTKREDVQWGESEQQANLAADSTFYYSNAVPQHAKLNQRIWLKLEDYILHKESVTNGYKICVFTGPALLNNDPLFVTKVNQWDIKLPILFWKVIYFLKDGKELHRVGFLMSQYSLLRDDGIIQQTEFVESIEPFMEFEKAAIYQVKVEKIEKLTGLKFAAAEETLVDNRALELIIEQVNVAEFNDSQNSRGVDTGVHINIKL